MVLHRGAGETLGILQHPSVWSVGKLGQNEGMNEIEFLKK